VDTSGASGGAVNRKRDADMANPAVRLDGVGKVYGSGTTAVTALDDVSLEAAAGSFTAIMGPSGSGKSTFLNCAAGLEHPTSGAVTIDGTALAGMNENTLTRFRRSKVGFVFQSFQLLPYLTVFQNTELPLRLTGGRIDRGRVAEVLADVGLLDRLTNLPAELSGGQQQRVAVARALITRPAVVFADEPTGALDSVSARNVLGLLRYAASELHQTIVMVTHDPVAAAYADSVVFLVDGRIHGRMHHPTAEAVGAELTQLGDRVATAAVQ
jgi:putative ABC transport system ATP-binding protein